MKPLSILLVALLLASCSVSPRTSRLVSQSVPGTPHPLAVPEGFTVTVFAELPSSPRFMAFSPDGVLHVTLPEPGHGAIVALPDRDGDGRADVQDVVANQLNRAHDIEFHSGALYVAKSDSVLRLSNPDTTGYYGDRETIIGDLPTEGQHWSRTIGFGPDGGLYLSVGSSCNVCVEEDPRRAAITRYEPDGTSPRPFAVGLRNAVGFIWNERGELVATNNGRDELGDDIPPDTIHIVKEGEDYGWPRCHAGDIPDPELGGPGACQGVAPPAFELPAHSAPLGLALYSGTEFPEEYHGDLFVALHGSFDRSAKAGYEVVRLRVEGGRPVAMEPFVAGWLVGQEHWGRPVDVVLGPDGALYISDDYFNAVYRVAYEGV